MSRSGIPRKVAGSVAGTSNNKLAMTFASPSEPARPTATPMRVEHHPLPDDEAKHVARLRAQRHADADLLSALRDRISHHAVNPDAARISAAPAKTVKSNVETRRVPIDCSDHVFHGADVVDRLVLIEAQHFASHGGSNRGGIAGGSNHQRHEIPAPVLRVRHIHLRARSPHPEQFRLGVADYADDFAREFFVAPDRDALAERRLGRTE